jgi:phosphatidylserine/phosphatidylglycerophosphate/cardiolipin synthase-like enzyme
MSGRVKLIVEPDDGIDPLLAEMKKARATLDTTIFRFDLADVETALRAAVGRGVNVRALVAHTNRGGEKLLRKLELRFLEHGITLARSGDDLVRYHGKMLVADRAALCLMLFNYTRLDAVRSRSFAVVTTDPGTVAEALRLFEADMTRQPYAPELDTFVVSPENARPVLADFIRGAQRQLLVYDPRLSDRMMIRLLEERAKNGVQIRVLGKIGKRARDISAAKLPGLRLHARVIIRDGCLAFLGSQSLRQLELDARREVGIIVDDEAVVRKLTRIFESDWRTSGGRADGTATPSLDAAGDETAAEEADKRLP